MESFKNSYADHGHFHGTLPDGVVHFGNLDHRFSGENPDFIGAGGSLRDGIREFLGIQGEFVSRRIGDGQPYGCCPGTGGWPSLAG